MTQRPFDDPAALARAREIFAAAPYLLVAKLTATLAIVAS